MVTQTADAACFQLGRERCRSFSTATQVCTPLRGCRVSSFAALRLTPRHPPPFRCSPPPLCFTLSAPPRSLEKAVSGTAPQSLGVLVRCRQSRPLWCQLPEWLRRRLTPRLLSARSGALPFVQHSYAGLHYTSGVSGVELRCAPADTQHPPRSAAALLRCASLSLRPSVARKSGI